MEPRTLPEATDWRVSAHYHKTLVQTFSILCLLLSTGKCLLSTGKFLIAQVSRFEWPILPLKSRNCCRYGLVKAWQLALKRGKCPREIIRKTTCRVGEGKWRDTPVSHDTCLSHCWYIMLWRRDHMLNTTFNSEIKSTKYDGYKRLSTVRMTATVKLIHQLLSQCRHRVTCAKHSSTTSSFSHPLHPTWFKHNPNGKIKTTFSTYTILGSCRLMISITQYGVQ